MDKLYRLIFIFSLFTISMAESLDFKTILKKNSEVKFLKITYLTRKNDNLALIYKKFVREDAVFDKSEEMVQKTFKGNDQSIDWYNTPAHIKVFIYLNIDFLDMDKISLYNENIALLAEKLKGQLSKEREGNTQNKGLKGSVFYMASYGKFSQTNPEVATLDSFQNSPVSLGLSASYYPSISPWSFSGSAYYSYLLSSASNIGIDRFSVPSEVGFNLYSDYKFKDYDLSGYFGFDYEDFTTFNLEGLQNERQIYFDKNKVLYLTIGASRQLKIFSKNFFAKLSFSQSISSIRSIEYSQAQDSTPYEGSKILLYVFKRTSEKFFAHALFKYHVMEGPSEITVLRLGVGFGYLIF